MWYVFILLLIIFVVFLVRLEKKASEKREFERKLKNERERQKNEREIRDKVRNLLNDYLDNLDFSGDENELVKRLEANNEAFMNYKSRIWYHWILGDKKKVFSEIDSDVNMFWHFHKKGDSECHGWGVFLSMLKDNRQTCHYRWGENRFDLTIHRFGLDRYAFIKGREEGVYK